MMSRHQNFIARIGRAFVPAAALLFLSCDPGFRYHLTGWTLLDDGPTSAAPVFDVEIETSGISGLIGDQGIMPTFTITNHGRETLVLEAAELRAAEGAHEAERLRQNGEGHWAVEPDGARRISLSWEFQRTAVLELGDTPSIMLSFRRGDELLRIDTAFSRQLSN